MILLIYHANSINIIYNSRIFSGEKMRVEMTIKLAIEAEEIIDREVRKHGTGAAIYVPKSWIGRKVKVIRLKE